MICSLYNAKHGTNFAHIATYKVASAVGLILIEIYGYEDRAARLHAIDLGIQMQLINVLRDVSEDYERGRVYLPVDVLAEFNIDVDDLGEIALASNPSWSAFVREYLTVVRRHQTSALLLFDYLDTRSRVQPQDNARCLHENIQPNNQEVRDVFTTPLKLSKPAKVVSLAED